jgi:hypothetical protein
MGDLVNPPVGNGIFTTAEKLDPGSSPAPVFPVGESGRGWFASNK